MTSDAADVERWQKVLAAEYSVLYAYGLVGAVLGAHSDVLVVSQQSTAAQCQDEHRRRRDACLARISAAGADPAVPGPFYDVTKPETAADAQILAADVELAACAAYAALAGATNERSRLVAANWLTWSAVTATRWSGEVPALPGFAEQSTQPQPP